MPRTDLHRLPTPHRKVGDHVGTPRDGFRIGQIAIVDTGNNQIEIRYFDRAGVVQLITPAIIDIKLIADEVARTKPPLTRGF